MKRINLKYIGQIIASSRLWVVFIGVWVALSIIMVLFAPSLADVGVTNEADFLPDDVDSVRTQQQLAEHFPDQTSEGQGLLVFYRAGGLTDADREYAQTLAHWLVSPDAPEQVKRVTSIFDNPALESVMVSQDGTTLLMPVDFNTVNYLPDTNDAVVAIRDHIAADGKSSGLSVFVTGPAAIGNDLLDTILDSTDRTTIATLILVVLVLLLVYRSPVASLAPLLTITAAFLVSRGLLGFLAQENIMRISSLLDSFIVVLIFGVGTDYALFLVSRFREELTRHDSREAAVVKTLSVMVPVLLASAGTVIVGMLGLAVGKFGLLQTTGPALAVTIGVTVAASLTLTPALLLLFGHYLFWPQHNNHNHRGANREHASPFWHKLATSITRRPLVTMVGVTVCMAIPFLALPQMERSFDFLAELPDDAEAAEGYAVVTEHFQAGDLAPVTVLVTGEEDALSTTALGNIQTLAAELAHMPGVSAVRTVLQPDGDPNTAMNFRVDSQLSTQAAEMRSFADAMEDLPTFRAMLEDIDIVAMFDTLNGYFSDLGGAYPEVLDRPAYQEARQQIGLVQAGFSGALTQTDDPAIWNEDNLAMFRTIIDDLATNMDAIGQSFTNPDAFFLPASGADAQPELGQLLATFVSADRQATRLDVILTDAPYSSTALDTIDRLDTMGNDFRERTGQSVSLGGPAVQVRDIRQTVDDDFNVIAVVVVLGVMVMFALLLRSVVAPVYLALTVMLSYGTSLGLATLFFQDILGHAGLNYVVPIIVFVLLVALGADYNIFLMSRVREERDAGKRTRLAVQVASAYTGSIITSAGIILAGTFAALVVSPLQMLFQIGLTIAVGILLDTFVVRAVLVPAIVSFLGEWSWWPSGSQGVSIKLVRQRIASLLSSIR
ncbi:MAG TPA: MMPL family transporter [Bellilinea sp.]|nr:MMPL family transporter [Bellilinea sp.]